MISILVILAGRKRPYYIAGWLWYLGTLVPVIGLVQAGVQAMANRFTYIPFIGLFIIVAYGVPRHPCGMALSKNCTSRGRRSAAFGSHHLNYVTGSMLAKQRKTL
jgi:hypothetical protein